MKKFILLAAAPFVLVACGTETPPKNNDHEDKPKVEVETKLPEPTDVTKEVVDTFEEGESCGGPEGKLCKPGLLCIKEIETAEEVGVCTSTVVDKNVVCEETKDPVCGLWNGKKKMTFLNECEAGRHGAEILHKSFCGRINDFEEPCEEKVLSIGVCNKFFTGVSVVDGKCMETPVMGCDVQAPFATTEKCEEVCG